MPSISLQKTVFRLFDLLESLNLVEPEFLPLWKQIVLVEPDVDLNMASSPKNSGEDAPSNVVAQEEIEAMKIEEEKHASDEKNRREAAVAVQPVKKRPRYSAQARKEAASPSGGVR